MEMTQPLPLPLFLPLCSSGFEPVAGGARWLVAPWLRSRLFNFRTPDIRLKPFERFVGPDRQLQAESGTGEFGAQGVEFRA